MKTHEICLTARFMVYGLGRRAVRREQSVELHVLSRDELVKALEKFNQYVLHTESGDMDPFFPRDE